VNDDVLVRPVAQFDPITGEATYDDRDIPDLRRQSERTNDGG
jgi:hypothetical protein